MDDDVAALRIYDNAMKKWQCSQYTEDDGTMWWATFRWPDTWDGTDRMTINTARFSTQENAHNYIRLQVVGELLRFFKENIVRNRRKY